MRFVNENAVTRAIKNLLMTNRNERLYQPNIGGDIQKLLFEPMMQSTADTLATSIRDTIDKYEPRAKVLNITVVPDYNGNAYTVNVVYMIINRQEPVSVNITLTRVR
jgi:phage baseplate assembly protein W